MDCSAADPLMMFTLAVCALAVIFLIVGSSSNNPTVMVFGIGLAIVSVFLFFTWFGQIEDIKTAAGQGILGHCAQP